MTKKSYKFHVLPLSKLKCGMVLAESIYTNTQMMIIPSGRRVNDEILEVLNFFTQQRQIGRRVAVLNEDYVDYRKSA